MVDTKPMMVFPFLLLLLLLHIACNLTQKLGPFSFSSSFDAYSSSFPFLLFSQSLLPYCNCLAFFCPCCQITPCASSFYFSSRALSDSLSLSLSHSALSALSALSHTLSHSVPSFLLGSILFFPFGLLRFLDRLSLDLSYLHISRPCFFFSFPFFLASPCLLLPTFHDICLCQLIPPSTHP